MRDNLQQNCLDTSGIVFQLIHAFRPRSKKEQRLSHLFLNKRSIYMFILKRKQRIYTDNNRLKYSNEHNWPFR